MTNGQALAGVRVLECAGGVAGAYCGKLFADMGAYVARPAAEGGDALAAQPLALEAPQTAGLLHRYLNAGKAQASPEGPWDIVILGEDTDRSLCLPEPRIATLDISWFGHDGPYAEWAGSDLVVQALSGMSHPCGPVEGPPTFLGEHQATMVGGVAAFCAGVAALIGGRQPAGPAVLDVSIFEAVIIMSELQMANAVALAMPIPRLGVNRYLPTCPLSIHRCREGWIGITPLTPAQWQSFCDMLGLADFRDDPDLLPARTRYPHADRIEPEFDRVFPTKTAMEWAALGRAHKVPMVIVPDAQGILDHPIFQARQSLARFSAEGRTYRVPRTPLRLERTPPRLDLDSPPSSEASAPLPAAGDPFAPLAGIRVADFSMGWAGPLATRMLADLGAEVIKIEAGRYPDWWRSVDWSPEAIARGQYEESHHFSFINRGKQSLSLDLTHPDGLPLAKQLVAESQVVVENQAAGVMPRLGLGHDALSAGRDDLIMLSMSAFGSGNAWSDTRAYGSVLEQ
ncbi:MAG: CoA transferase, partial [Alphaproteobacteria bacterium]|nr:CoA transferase [Alphaproteobacteria bacterium]